MKPWRLNKNKGAGFTLRSFNKNIRARTRYTRKGAGFTLVEMLVVIFIIGLVSSIMIVNWRKNEKQYQLQGAAQEIVQNIRKAQQMALSGAKITTQPINSYGLYFEVATRTSYLIFADRNDNKQYDLGSDLIVGDAAIPIKSGFEINSLTSPEGASLNGVAVTFNLPDAITTIRKTDIGGNPFPDSLTITIRKVGTTCPSKTCKGVVIIKTGQVNVQ